MNIDTMLSDLLKVEGGYSNNPHDAGGETKFGITKAVAVANGYSGPMKDLTRAQAISIYQAQYFLKPGFDKVLAEGLAGTTAELFDTGVNMGTATATKFLQQALNALNNNGKLYADITADGSIGPATVAALRGLVRARGVEDADTVLMKALNCLQGARYIALAEARPANENFVFGWLMNRVNLPVAA